MSQKEIKRIKVMELLVNGKLTNQEAAEALGLCRRQIIRLKKKYLARAKWLSFTAIGTDLPGTG
ncbi:MAG: helix-turn-helix domain-containing protein [Fretibacterium sp.]|nr:helix-turn-helix domain-containing protein [Fretibacterium sp.]